MKFYTIVRRSNETGREELCVGSSPLSGKPYWQVMGAEPTIQILMFRDLSYAQWCIDIARREDAKPEEYTYTVGGAEVQP